MKILVVSHSYPSEDNKHAFGFVHARVKLYKKYGYTTYVLVPLYGSSFKEINAYIFEGIKVFRVNVNYIEEIINVVDPDVIAYHFPEPRAIIRLLSTRGPLVLWFHGADALIRFFHYYYDPFTIKNLINGLISIPNDIKHDLLLRKIIFKYRTIQMITPSYWMKKMLLRYLMLSRSDIGRIHVIPNPVDTDKFKPIKPCYERQRNVGISVRALYYKYGVDMAIRAMCGLKDVKLILVGDGPLREYLKSISEKCKANIEYIYQGIPHEELPRYYNEAGFFLAPSRTEAQGVAMCEALACGTPAIATNVGGIPEFVIHGFNGILVKPKPVELRKALRMIVSISDKKYCEMSQNAVNYARRTYSSKIIIPKELEILIRAIELYDNFKVKD